MGPRRRAGRKSSSASWGSAQSASPTPRGRSGRAVDLTEETSSTTSDDDDDVPSSPLSDCRREVRPRGAMDRHDSPPRRPASPSAMPSGSRGADVGRSAASSAGRTDRPMPLRCKRTAEDREAARQTSFVEDDDDVDDEEENGDDDRLRQYEVARKNAQHAKMIRPCEIRMEEMETVVLANIVKKQRERRQKSGRSQSRADRQRDRAGSNATSEATRRSPGRPRKERASSSRPRTVSPCPGETRRQVEKREEAGHAFAQALTAADSNFASATRKSRPKVVDKWTTAKEAKKEPTSRAPDPIIPPTTVSREAAAKAKGEKHQKPKPHITVRPAPHPHPPQPPGTSFFQSCSLPYPFPYPSAGLANAILWTRRTMQEKQAQLGSLSKPSRQFHELMTRGDEFTMDMFARRFSEMAPICQQTGVLTHEAASERPFKPVDLRQKDKRTEEKMLNVLTALRTVEEPLAPIMPPRSQALAHRSLPPPALDMPKLATGFQESGDDGTDGESSEDQEEKMHEEMRRLGMNPPPKKRRREPEGAQPVAQPVVHAEVAAGSDREDNQPVNEEESGVDKSCVPEEKERSSDRGSSKKVEALSAFNQSPKLPVHDSRELFGTEAESPSGADEPSSRKPDDQTGQINSGRQSPLAVNDKSPSPEVKNQNSSQEGTHGLVPTPATLSGDNLQFPEAPNHNASQDTLRVDSPLVANDKSTPDHDASRISLVVESPSRANNSYSFETLNNNASQCDKGVESPPRSNKSSSPKGGRPFDSPASAVLASSEMATVLSQTPPPRGASVIPACAPIGSSTPVVGDPAGEAPADRMELEEGEVADSDDEVSVVNMIRPRGSSSSTKASLGISRIDTSGGSEVAKTARRAAKDSPASPLDTRRRARRKRRLSDSGSDGINEDSQRRTDVVDLVSPDSDPPLPRSKAASRKKPSRSRLKRRWKRVKKPSGDSSDTSSDQSEEGGTRLQIDEDRPDSIPAPPPPPPSRASAAETSPPPPPPLPPTINVIPAASLGAKTDEGGADETGDEIVLNAEESDLFGDNLDEDEEEGDKSERDTRVVGEDGDQVKVDKEEEVRQRRLLFQRDLEKQMDPAIRIKCETLVRRQICFKLLEFGSCTRKGRCKQHHPNRPAVQDVVDFFVIIRDSFPQMLPPQFQNQSDDRIPRLMGIYKANKAHIMEDRETFLNLYGDVLAQVSTMVADSLVLDLRNFIALCQGYSEHDCPRLIALVLQHISVLRNLPVNEKSEEATQCMNDSVWDVAFFIVDHSLTLPLMEFRFLPFERYHFLYAERTGFDEYNFLLNHLVRHDRDVLKVTFLLRHLTYLPTFKLPAPLLETALRRVVKDKNQQGVLDVAGALRDTDESLLKALPASVLQQFVNVCQKQIGAAAKRGEEQGRQLRGHLAPTLHRLVDAGVEGLVFDQSIARPLASSAFETHVASLVRKGKWAELEREYRDRIKRDKTLCEVSQFLAAVLDAFLDPDNSAATIAKHFSALVDALTLRRTAPFLPVEKTLMAQLAGSLIVHIEGMPITEPSGSSSGDPCHIYRLCVEVIKLHPWAAETICNPHSAFEPVRRGRAPLHRIAICSVRVLLRRNLGYQASCIMLRLAIGLLNGEGNPSFVDAFYAARELIEVLLRDREKEITGVLLVKEVCELYDIYLAGHAENYGDQTIPLTDKAYVVNELFNSIVKFALAKVWTGGITKGPGDVEVLLRFIIAHQDHAQADLACVRGLIHVLKEKKIRVLSKRFYDIGLCHGFYPEQQTSRRKIVINQSWTNCEMSVVIESFLDAFLDDVMGEDEVEYLAQKAERVRSPEEMSRLGQRLALSVELAPPADHAALGLPFIDSVAKTAASRKKALARLTHVFRKMSPKLTLLGDAAADWPGGDDGGWDDDEQRSRPPCKVEPLSLIAHLFRRVQDRRSLREQQQRQQLLDEAAAAAGEEGEGGDSAQGGDGQDEARQV